MALRNYSSTAAQTTLSGGVDAATTTFTVSSTTGFPATPFVLAIDSGAAAQELVLVTNVASTTLTVTRGYDSTVAASHDTGAVVAHSHAGIDFREANAHVNATSNVHGVSGSLVGTSEAQSLLNKNLSSGTNTFPSSLATLTGAQTLTNKTLTDPVIQGMTWTTYTPTWTATTTAPALGNGNLSGRYVRVGSTVHYYIALGIGSTTTLGSGRWNFSLPVSPIAYADGNTVIGRAIAKDLGSRNYGMDAVFTAPNLVHCWRDAGDTEATATPTTPHAWAAGDYLIVMGTYEAA